MSPTAPFPQSSASDRLGDLLVAEGMITQEQLRDALEAQASSPEWLLLGEVLVRQKILTREQLTRVMDSDGGRSRLGQVLVRSGTITQEQLDAALAQQRVHKLPLGQLLVKLGYVSDEKMRQALSLRLNVPFVDLDRMTLDPALARLINRSYARRHLLIPVTCVGESLTVCMDDPTNEAAIADLRRFTGKTVTVVTASLRSIENAFGRLYTAHRDNTSRPVQERLQVVLDDARGSQPNKYTERQATRQGDALVRHLLTIAIERRASDIHMEMLPNRFSVRLRVDGILETPSLGELQDACNQGAREILSRIKILAGLDIAERRRPQDGSFRVKLDKDGRESPIDLRVSLVPSAFGESMVLRVLDATRLPKSLEALGFPLEIAHQMPQLLRRPSGIVLVTGPTGSGKSTTLYAALNSIYRPEIRILTVEDPIEYVYEQFSQSEINEQIGNTFASYLRAFLRHDPEVIMVGEIRDEETAEIAFRAAQTGHLLLSTLHTNFAVEAINRLRDLGVDANLLASSLAGVLGQRLVRSICPDCKVEYRPSDELLRQFFADRQATMALYKGSGCGKCNFTGYRGRVAVVELWVPDDDDVILMAQDAPIDQIRAKAARNTFTMAECAWRLLQQGRTNMEELIRMLPYAAIQDMRTRRAVMGEMRKFPGEFAASGGAGRPADYGRRDDQAAARRA
jgi:type IV pilus assembly protein PilB